MVLKLPQGHEDSEYVLSFEIGQREGGFYSGRTDGLDRQTDRHTEPPSTVLVYRYIYTRGEKSEPRNTRKSSRMRRERYTESNQI